MKSHLVLALAATLLLIPSAGLLAAGQPVPAGKPNICLLLADDLRADCIGALGHPIVKTPNIDRLVERGLIFRRAYTLGSHVSAVCIPSRQMILRGVGYFRRQPESPTLAETFRAAGYVSQRSGKPKNGDLEFDENLDGSTAAGHVDNLIRFVQAHAGKRPLFLYMAGHEPHDPQFATEEFYRMYPTSDIPLPVNFRPYHPFDNGEMAVRDERTLPWPRTKENVTGKLAKYYASISYWDAQVGRLIEALKDAGQYDNTIFIVSGDNGLSLGEHGLLGKQNLYEFGGMHVPLIFAGPGIRKGETKAFAYLMDLYPTLCELTGTAIPAKLDGRSLGPVIAGKSENVRDFLFTGYKDVQRAIRDDRWKLIRYPQIDKTQLFDLQADPHEMTDLSGKLEQTDRIRALLAAMKQLQRQLGDDTPLEIANPVDPSWRPGMERGNPVRKKGK